MEERPFSDLSYRQFLNEEKLMGTKCRVCNSHFVPPRTICINCHSSDMQWIELKGNGRLAAFTCISVGPPVMIAEGYDRERPYCSGVVELEEGGKVDARIEGIDTKKPDSIKIGMPLKVKYLHRGEGPDSRTYLAFEPIL